MPDRFTEESDEQPNLSELISLSEAAKISGLSPSHLRLLVNQGEIWGKKFGRNWLTTEKAVREYMKRERRPGPKPKKGLE
jgi:excisionase family DNA binding protein